MGLDSKPSRSIERRASPFAGPPVTPSEHARVAPATATATGPGHVVEGRPAAILGRELRSMTGHEEELVERWTSEDTGGLCNELLARCLVGVGERPDDARARVLALTVIERDLALVALRRASFGDRVETQVRCPSCGEVSEVEFDLSELPSDLPPLPARVIVPLDQGEAELRLPTAGDQEALYTAMGDAPELSEARRRSWVLARLLVRLGSRSGPLSPDEVHALPSHLRRSLEQAIDGCAPEFELGFELRCQGCANAFTAPFDIGGFFLPR